MISDPRHRALHRQLWIDTVRTELDKAISPDELERSIKLQTLARMSGQADSFGKLAALPPERQAFELLRAGLSGPLSVAALSALERRGYPQQEMSIPEDWLACGAIVNAALNWCGFDILRSAVVGFYLDYWESIPHTKARWPATLGIWFGGFTAVTVDGAARKQIGFEPGSSIEGRITKECEKVARNLWDFVTSRSISYDHIKRKKAKHPPVGDHPQHTQGVRSQFDREVFLLYLTHEGKLSEPGDGRPRQTPWGCRIEVPGSFHEWVYCADCGRTHTHELLGQACRRCGEIVGPRANVLIKKHWQPPYVAGPEGAPVKDVVRRASAEDTALNWHLPGVAAAPEGRK